MAGHVNGLKLRRVMGLAEWLVPQPWGPDGWSMTSRDGTASVIVTCADQDDGTEWLHASIARDHMPSYEDLVLLHKAVFAPGWAYQVFAPPSAHVSIHVHALHLWGRLDGAPVLPQFGMDVEGLGRSI